MATPRESLRQRQLVSSLMDRGAAPREPRRIGIGPPLMILRGLGLELWGGKELLLGVSALESVLTPNGSGPKAPLEAPSTAGRGCGVVNKHQFSHCVMITP